MHTIGFDGYIPYDEPDFQKFVKDLKTATDAFDAAYKSFADDLHTYLALLGFTERYLILRDKARLAAFVEDELGGDPKAVDGLPGDEIEAAIDAEVQSMVGTLNFASKDLEGRSPDIEFDWGIPVDHGPAIIDRPILASVLFKAEAKAKAMRAYQSATLRPAIKREFRRTVGIVQSAEQTAGPLDKTISPPLEDQPERLRTRLAEVGPLADVQHAGLIEFRRFVEAALTRDPDATPEKVIAAFRVTATNLPSEQALLRHWVMMIGLSSWPRTANVISLTNNAGFVMKARVVHLTPGGEAAEDWTDHFPIGSTRRIPLVHPGKAAQPFQIEVDATAGLTRRSASLFQSFLPGEEVAEVSVSGATLGYDIDVR